MSEAPVPGLLYGPGLAISGVALTAHFSPDALQLDGVEAAGTALSALHVRHGGFNGTQLFLDWESVQGRYSFTPRDPASLIAAAPPALAARLAQLTRSQRGKRRRNSLWLGVLAVVLLLPFLLLGALFTQGERVADWITARISLEQEKQLGEMAFRQATSGLALRQQGLAWEAVQDMGKRLTAGSKYTYQWYVAQDANINAFAVPGGYVVVNTGLIAAADTPEEVAGVLAHEVQHVEQRHTLKNIVHSLGMRALITLALGDVAGALGNLAGQLGELKFSRDLESEADRLALDSLRRAQISPRGMVSFFDKLARQGGSPPTLLSTHPASDDRRAALEKLIAEKGKWPTSPLPYPWATIRASAK
jgi:Zn-dependent protease with chaperone function